MRWGVGKGRFRNLTATILSVFLALTFLGVWTFFNRIKPLTIDTSSLSQTASIADRLINTSTSSDEELRETDLQLFCRIADSVHSIYSHEFPLLKPKSNKKGDENVTERLRQTRILIRKQIAFMLNQSYTSIARYRQCEAKVLHVLSLKQDDMNVLQHELQHQPDIERSSALIRQRSAQTTPSAAEHTLIEECAYRLRPHLIAFEFGLSLDDSELGTRPTTLGSSNTQTTPSAQGARQ